MAEFDNAAMYPLLAGVAADVREMKMQLAEKADKRVVENLRQALTEYHSSVLGHGILIGEMEDRIRPIEKHLNLPPYAAE